MLMREAVQRGAWRWQEILWPAAACLLALALELPRLGQRALWADEADTALYAESILKWGVPRAFTERWLASYWQQSTNDGLIQNRLPWLSYYVAAGSFALFGRSAWSARLPFALAAVAAVPCLYFMALRLTGSRAVGAVACFLCATNVSFLLYARQARYYGIAMLVSVLLCWKFLDVSLRRWRGITAFVVLASVLYYSQPITAISFVAALGLMACVWPGRRERLPGVAVALAATAALAVPWLLYSAGGLEQELGKASAMERLHIASRLSLLYFRDYAGLGWVPVLMVPPAAVAAVQWPAARQPLAYVGMLTVASTALSSLLFLQAGLPGWDFRSVVRYQVGLLPIVSVMMAIAIVFVARSSRLVAAVIFVLAVSTSVLWEPVNGLRWRRTWHEPSSGLLTVWSPLANYLYEIAHDVEDAPAVVAAILAAQGESGERVLVSPPWMSDVLAFETSLTFVQPPQRAYRSREAAMARIPQHLLAVDDGLDWGVDFDGRLPRSVFEGFEVHTLQIPFPVEPQKPELWWHAFRTIERHPSDWLPLVYRRVERGIGSGSD